MRKFVLAAVAAAIMAVAAPAAAATEPEIVKWLKDPCIPTGDLENSCQLPPLLP